MIKRKVLTLLIASLISIILITLYFTLRDKEGLIGFFHMSILITYFVVPISILYGFPVSLLAERLSRAFTSTKRMGLSLLIHLSFGVSFIFLFGFLFDNDYLLHDFSNFWREYEWFFMASLLTSICFWVVDEIVRYKI